MATVEALYQDGVFKPLEAVTLSENQRVRLEVRTVVTTPVEEWIAEAQALQRKMIAEHGLLIGSTDVIAEDRQRDV